MALGLQLYAMGFVDEPILSLSSEVCRIYEDLMDEHGDKLALQYAGSQLVHSIKTYKKISAFQVRLTNSNVELVSLRGASYFSGAFD